MLTLHSRLCLILPRSSVAGNSAVIASRSPGGTPSKKHQHDTLDGTSSIRNVPYVRPSNPVGGRQSGRRSPWSGVQSTQSDVDMPVGGRGALQATAPKEQAMTSPGHVAFRLQSEDHQLLVRLHPHRGPRSRRIGADYLFKGVACQLRIDARLPAGKEDRRHHDEASHGSGRSSALGSRVRDRPASAGTTFASRPKELDRSWRKKNAEGGLSEREQKTYHRSLIAFLRRRGTGRRPEPSSELTDGLVDNN